MSVVFTLNDCTLISHEKFINQIYKNYVKNGTENGYRIADELFELNVPYRSETVAESNTRHRKAIDKRESKEIEENQTEFDLIQTIKSKTNEFLVVCRDQSFIPAIDETPKDNLKMKTFLTEWNNHVSKKFPQFLAGNSSNVIECIDLIDERFLIPPECSIHCIDIEEMDWTKLNSSYDLIVIDPPWWNKYVRRTKKFNDDNGYRMLSNHLIEKIPIENLTKANQTIVGIWCTNSPTMIKAIKESFLPKWKLRLISTWYWIKITKYGETICEFSLPLKKQPFERLFIACPIDTDRSFEIPEEKFIFSIPSAIHSHKPPLDELLMPYLSKSLEKPTNLEIFSRYLLPHWTAVGLEVLKLQNLRLFKHRSSIE